MEFEQGSGFDHDGHRSQSPWSDEQRQPAQQHAIGRFQIGGSFSGPIQYRELMFEHEVFGDDGFDPVGPQNLGEENQ